MKLSSRSYTRAAISITGVLAFIAAVSEARSQEAAPAVEEKTEEKPLVGYDKGFFLTDEKGLFRLVIGARIQGRLAFERVEAHETGEDGEDVAATKDEDSYQFSLPQVRLMGASVQADFDAGDEGTAATRGELDFIMKVRGFSIDGAVYVTSAQDGDGFTDQSYAAWGLHAQAGYVIAGYVEPVIRYALVDLDGDDNNTQEILGGLAIYVFKHNLKWQTEAGSVLRQDPAGNLDDVVVRTQLGLAF